MSTGSRWSFRAALFGALSLAPAASSAPAQDDQACTAELSPSSIRVESPGTRVTARLSREIGAIEAVEDRGGVRLTTTAELELMAKVADRDPDDADVPVSMSDDGRTATLWLNTEDAEPGPRTLTLEGETGTCTFQLAIRGLERRGPMS